jgi:hypothetical protein
MRTLLDSGALIALERQEPAMVERLAAALQGRSPPLCHGGIVGQVWRGQGPRQARLARVLAMMDIRALDARLGRAAGELLARTRQHDVIDAALVVLAHDGDRIITSDPDDLAPLVRAADLDVELVRP